MSEEQQQEVRFPVEAGESCAATFFPARGSAEAGARPSSSTSSAPVVVLGTGLGGVRDMRLDAYAERFAAAGYACLTFTHRHFGDSDGEPRQLVDVAAQRADWRAAVAHARTLPGVDPDRVVVWGTSFGGGNVIATASEHPAGVVAVIAQCPFTSGLASTLAVPPLTSVRLTAAAARDVVRGWRGAEPLRVPTAGRPGTTALMTAPDALPGYEALLRPGTTYVGELAARTAFAVLRYHPGRLLRRVAVPTLLCVCTPDSVAPARPTLRAARRSPVAEVRTYGAGHFGIYVGEAFETVVADQLDFLRRRVPAA